MSIHKDHRARVKERYEKQGLDHFSGHEVLELLLFYCIPRVDTNEIAHKLINRFGSFENVLDAPLKELEKIDGIGHNAGLFLKLIREVERYYHISKDNNELRERKLSSRDDCGRYMAHYFDGSKVEKVYLLCLDGKNKVLCCRQVNEGSVNCTEISTRKIVDIALTENATSVVLAHNHPSGLAVPSALDVQATLRIIQALQHVDVMVVDHVIVADEDHTSMVDSNYIDKSFCYDVFGGAV